MCAEASSFEGLTIILAMPVVQKLLLGPCFLPASVSPVPQLVLWAIAFEKAL
jgi:hypothetical protein